VSTLDRFHDESEYRLPIPAPYNIDSEGVTPGREVNADYTIRPTLRKRWGVWKRLYKQARSLSCREDLWARRPLLSSREEDNAFANSMGTPCGWRGTECERSDGFQFAAQPEPGPLENADSDSGQALCHSPSEAQGNSAPSRRYQTQPWSRKVRIVVWIAVYVMALTAAPKRHQDGWCLHGRRISPVVQYRITPIKNWIGSSRTGSDSRKCQGSASSRHRSILGLVNYVRTFPAQSSADFKDDNTAHTRHPDAPWSNRRRRLTCICAGVRCFIAPTLL